MPRPRSESFYLKLTPDVSAVLSINTKASLSPARSPRSPRSPPPPPPPTSSTPLSPSFPCPLPHTPLISIVALPDDADDKRDRPSTPTLGFSLPRKRSDPDLNFTRSPQSQSPPTRHPWSPNLPSPLRSLPSKPFFPSLVTTHLHPTLSSPPSNPKSRPQPHPRNPLYNTTLKKAFFAGPSGSSLRRFGVRTAWNIDDDVRRAQATNPLPSSFDFSSSEENADDGDEDEDDDNDNDVYFSSSHHSPNINPQDPILPVHIYLRTAVALPAQFPTDQSDEDTSSGSDGGEHDSSTNFDESSSDEEAIDLENEHWETISI